MATERWTPRVTAAAVIERDGAYLLVEEETSDGLRLNNPCGHLEPGESPLQAVVREALEESAHVFTPTHLVGLYLSRFQRPHKHERPQADDKHRPPPEGMSQLGSDPSLALEDVTYLRLSFAGTVGEAIAGRALDRGIVRTLWMTLDELHATRARHRSPLVWRNVADHQAGKRYPLALITTDESLYQPGLLRHVTG